MHHYSQGDYLQGRRFSDRYAEQRRTNERNLLITERDGMLIYIFQVSREPWER